MVSMATAVLKCGFCTLLLVLVCSQLAPDVAAQGPRLSWEVWTANQRRLSQPVCTGRANASCTVPAGVQVGVWKDQTDEGTLWTFKCL
jgi:hypothetical protein